MNEAPLLSKEGMLRCKRNGGGVPVRAGWALGE